MGLDMYLTKKSYVKNWDFQIEKGHPAYKVTVSLDGKKVGHIKPDRITYVIEEVGYWRKANAIHNWFVNEVQDGKDDCREYEVDAEKLFELQALCQNVMSVVKLEPGKVRNGYTFNRETGEKEYYLEDGMVVTNPEEIAAILPTKGGFFFGSTDYDQWFIEDIESTLKILNPILKELTQVKANGGTWREIPAFYYRASW